MNIVKVKDLTCYQLDKAVAIAENIEVVDRKGHVAIELKWDPETPCNDSDMQLGKMWLFYEPTKDWSLAGPIIERENISILCNSVNKEKIYWWCPSNGEFSLWFDSPSPIESAMRRFVFKFFGDTIDLDAPPCERNAIVRAHGCKSEFHWAHATENDLYDDTLVVTARTSAEAKKIVWEQYKHFLFVDIEFIGWE